jgi:hypothetical protein
MPDTSLQAPGVRAEYAAKVAADLKRNTLDQERITTEVAALEEQLRTLRHDHDLLVNVQRALGDVSGAGSFQTAVGEIAQVPKPRSAGPRRKKAGAAKTTKATKASKSGIGTTTPGPTLVGLVRDHLARDAGPQSAAEITAALDQSHPDRVIKLPMVRNTLEGLVSKSEARRNKQGRSVFYTAVAALPAPATGHAQAATT